MKRCSWCGSDQLMVDYHDQEWGRPVYDDNKLFEMIILEGAQAGLNWSTILKRREGYRIAFDNFDAQKIVKYNDQKLSELINNPGIIRNKLKIIGTVKNAEAFLEVQEQYDSFSKFIWQFVDGKPIKNSWKNVQEYPTRSVESDKMAKELKKRGFTFVGTTICYAFMQAVGMVNDHTVDCYLYNHFI
jgi:DNA-3-methyladenine glycosylase I